MNFILDGKKYEEPVLRKQENAYSFLNRLLPKNHFRRESGAPAVRQGALRFFPSPFYGNSSLVLLDGLPVNVCTLPAFSLRDRIVRTPFSLKKHPASSRMDLFLRRENPDFCPDCRESRILAFLFYLKFDPEERPYEREDFLMKTACSCLSFNRLKSLLKAWEDFSDTPLKGIGSLSFSAGVKPPSFTPGTAAPFLRKQKRKLEPDSSLYYPQNPGACLSLLRRYPEASLHFHALQAFPERNGRLILNLPVISVSGLAELWRIGLQERFMDIGSLLTVKECLRDYGAFLPDYLPGELRRMNREEPFGSQTFYELFRKFFSRKEISRVLMFFFLSGIRAEFKTEKKNRSGRTRVVSIRKSADCLLAENSGQEESPAILTRIRLPRKFWTDHYFKKLPASGEGGVFILFRREKSKMTEMRIGIRTETGIFFLAGELRKEILAPTGSSLVKSDDRKLLFRVFREDWENNRISSEHFSLYQEILNDFFDLLFGIGLR